MSDFLSRLANRSFGITPVIRPRLAALFEPVHRAGAQFPSFTAAGFQSLTLSRDVAGQTVHPDQSSIGASEVDLSVTGQAQTGSDQSQVEGLSPGSSVEIGRDQVLPAHPQNPQSDPAECTPSELEWLSPRSSLEAGWAQLVPAHLPHPRPKPGTHPHDLAVWHATPPESSLEEKVRSVTYLESPMARSGPDVGDQLHDPTLSPAGSRESRPEEEAPHPGTDSAPEFRSQMRPPRGQFLPAKADSLPGLACERIPVCVAKSRALSPFPSHNGGWGPDAAKVPTHAAFARGRVERGAAGRQTDPEPTVQVNIGRIEVRATPPSIAPGRSERRPPAAMSLDEYLRHRTKRGGQ